MHSSRSIGKVFIYMVLILFSAIMILPFISMLLTSLETITESTQVPPLLWPKSWLFQNYMDVWNSLPFLQFYINTFAVVILRIICAVVFSSMAAYAFARIKFPGRDALFMVVLIQMMIPSQLFIVPQYEMMSSLGWLNTIKALVFPGLVSAFGTFLLRQFFLGIPDELEEAGILDGCGRFQLFVFIALPLAHSGLVAVGIFTALFAWKDLLWPMVVNMSIDKMPLSAGLASLQGQFNTNYPQLMAGSTLAIIPMIILFIIFQKQFIQGIATTGSKN